DRLNPVALNNDQFRYESNRLVTYYDPIGKKQTYGYPFYLDTTIMVYNQPIFDNYQVDVSTDTPWSWNLFDYVIRKVTNLTNPNSGIYGTMLAGMMSFEAYFYGNGSHLFNNYLVDSSHIEGDSDHALGVFNFINKLMHTYEVMPDWENQGTLGTVMDLVNQSRVSTVFQPVSLVYPLLNETFVGKAGDLAVMETPENGGALHGQAFLLHAALEEAVKEDLINFCNFMTSSDVQLSLATNGYVAPTLKETYSLSEFNDDPVLKTIKKAIDRAYQKPISLYMHDIEETFQNQVFQFLQGDRSPEQLQTAISILFKQILPETAINDGLPPEEQPITESTTEKKSGFIGLDYWVIIVGIMIMGILTHQYKEKRK
ncbi:MAG: extracellular solute-binding protein, partial [Promethearchaeota archaeon]